MQLLLYGVQLTLGYFLMLIAMTYEVELFLMVITGPGPETGLGRL